MLSNYSIFFLLIQLECLHTYTDRLLPGCVHCDRNCSGLPLFTKHAGNTSHMYKALLLAPPHLVMLRPERGAISIILALNLSDLLKVTSWLNQKGQPAGFSASTLAE